MCIFAHNFQRSYPRGRSEPLDVVLEKLKFLRTSGAIPAEELGGIQVLVGDERRRLWQNGDVNYQSLASAYGQLSDLNSKYAPSPGYYLVCVGSLIGMFYSFARLVPKRNHPHDEREKLLARYREDIDRVSSG